MEEERAPSPSKEHHSKRKKFLSSIGKALKKPKNPSKSKSLSDLTRAALHNDYRFQNATENGFKRQTSTESKGSQRSSIDRNSLDAVSLGNQSSLGDADEDQMSVDDVDYQSSPTHSRTSSQISNLDDFISDKPRKESNDANSGKTAADLWKNGITSIFTITGEVVSGNNLIARDKCGTSDPYVKVKINQKCIHKTKIVFRDLCPTWNESFEIPLLDDINTDLVFKVYDFDRLSHNDYMGEAKIDLSTLEVSREQDIELSLINRLGFQENLGTLNVRLTVIPKNEDPGSMEHLAQIFTASKQRVKQSSKTHLFDSILSVILKDGKNFRPADHGGLRDPFVRFKLAGDKYKSKLCKQTLNPSWREQFDMKIVMSSEDLPPLEITVWDKESGKEEFMGRTSCDLRELQPEKSHYLELDLVDQPGVISLYVALTAQNAIGCVSDLTRHEDDEEYLSDVKNEFSLFQTFGSLKKIGWLQIKLHSASGLAVADLGGASDPFAVIELGNQRLVTQTIYKNLNPRWEKIYDLAVYDIHDVIDITVFDEDKRGAPEFLGRIKIPLLSITSCEKCFYQLKDKRLQGPAKGYLALTFNLEYNPVRASVRTFRPREERILDEPPRFRRQLLQHNVDRLTNLIRSIIATGEFIQSLFTWKYKSRSLFAFLIYVLLVMNFDWFMLPLILFLVLLKNYTIHMLSPTRNQEEDLASQVDDDDDDEDDDKKKGKGKSFREKLEAINNICRLVQNHMDKVASLGERVKNTFNWSVPFLSYLLMVILLLGTILLYLVPLRYLLLAWGINKFTKRIRKPNAIPNNELLDFLSRVPSDPEVKQYRSIKIDST